MTNETTNWLLFFIFIAIAFPGSFAASGPTLLTIFLIGAALGFLYVVYRVGKLAWEVLQAATKSERWILILCGALVCSLLTLFCVTIPGALGFEYLARTTVLTVAYSSLGVILVTSFIGGIIGAKHEDAEELRIAKAYEEFQAKQR